MARPGLHIDSGGSGVLVYRAGEVLDPDAFEWFMADLAQLFQLLSDPQRHAQMQTAKDDLRAAAAQLPGVAAERLLATLTPDDEVDAFVRQSPPRSIPASIGAWRDEGAPIRFLALLAVFAVGAALMTGAFILQGEWLGTLFGAWFVVVLTVLIVVVAGERLRLTRLLRHGEFAVAKVERVEPTKVKTGRGRIFDVTVRYQARGQAREGKCRLDGLAADRAQRLATYGKPAAILYDPVNPERVLLIDVLANG
jgi:hypothetical protein